MKAISEALRGHLSGEVTTLATLWRLTRADGVTMGFTDHDGDIAFDGLTYGAASGFVPTAVAGSAGLAVDNLEIRSVLDSEEIHEGDLLAGVYDGAEVDVMLVNFADPAAGALHLRRGTLGEVRLSDAGFVAELRGMTEAFARIFGQVYTPGCRADLGDARCRVGLSAWTATGSVGEALDRQTFTDAARGEPAGWFDGGLLTWTSGANAGARMEVRRFAAGLFTLFLPMPRDVAPGDQYTVVAGCDKRFATCRDKFGNAVNFQGEPHVPGNDFLIAAAGR